MIQFPRYESYKDSGIEWLGEIPSHWEIKRLRFLCSVKTGEKDTIDKIDSGEYPFFVRSQTIERIDTYSFDEEAVLTAGDGVGVGKVFHYIDGKFDYHQRVYKFSHFKEVLGKLFYYYIKSFLFEEVIKLSAKSTVDSVRLPMLLNFKLTLGNQNEQQKIVEFLDCKTEKIDEAIAKKQKLIELLQEQKAILINRSVTKGLNPNVKMRDSGIEWIGEIPEHWEVKRAKYLFKEIDERSETGKEELLSVSHITGVTPRSEKNVNMFMAEDYTGSKTCRKDDLVINIMWAWMGALGVSDRTGIVSSSYGVFRQQKSNTFDSWYLEHLLRSTEYVAQYNRVSTGLHSSRLRLYADVFLGLFIKFPPREEQEKIKEVVTKRIQETNRTINSIEKEIRSLEEIKTILISNAVTGKIKI